MGPHYSLAIATQLDDDLFCLISPLLGGSSRALHFDIGSQDVAFPKDRRHGAGGRLPVACSPRRLFRMHSHWPAKRGQCAHRYTGLTLSHIREGLRPPESEAQFLASLITRLVM